MVSGARAYVDDFYTIGKNMALGLKNGFTAQKWTVKNAVDNMVESITASARAKMKIKSPSRVWAEIGDYMAQGLDVGFVGAMSQVTKDIQNAIPSSAGDISSGVNPMASQTTPADMVEAFKEALSDMKIVLDDEVAGEFVERTVTRVIYA